MLTRMSGITRFATIAKEFFECDLAAGKTATQARMGEHNFFSKKETSVCA